MSTGGVKLRTVTSWMAVMMVVASVALAHVWKQQRHASLSREVVLMLRERDALATEVLLLETQMRGLRQYSRLESVARNRLGLVNPGQPILIQPSSQALARRGNDANGGKDTIQAARWRGFR